ncbi:MAG: RidA family protein [SAR324 cluster bacterium]|nr:RidA family protein [SAR324 cluster bacterium]
MSILHEIPDVSSTNAPSVTYSHVVRAGNVLYVAGQAGMDYRTGEIPDDFESQARQAFENLSSLLDASGSSLDKVVKTTIWLCNANNFAKLNELYSEFFPDNPPTRSTPIVCLPLKELHISIECIALV